MNMPRDPSTASMEKAKELWQDVAGMLDNASDEAICLCMADALDAARAEALAPFVKAGLATAEGVPVCKGVLGKPVLTADGYMVGDDAVLFVLHNKERVTRGTVIPKIEARRNRVQWMRVRAYSSRQAAIAADSVKSGAGEGGE